MIREKNILLYRKKSENKEEINMSRLEIKEAIREMELAYFETGDILYLDEINELKRELEAM